MLHDDDIAAIEAEVAAEIDEAVAFAEAGAWEPVEDLTRDVYAEAREAAAMSATRRDHLPRGGARGDPRGA